MTSSTTTVDINGESRTVRSAPLTPLASVLREELGLRGTKLGCQAGDCGSCTALVDEVPVASCLFPVAHAEGRRVTTVEGLLATESGAALREAFRAHNASQCGFCIPGILMAAAGLLGRGAPLDRDEVIAGLAGNLCRCTGYESIVAAILDADSRLRAQA
jgi:aerobic-type carbon monoxide dehydrogenase small subunit (CoxS/CutS family)